jgi:hypothetical protein
MQDKPAGHIHGRGVPERLLGLGQDPLQKIRLIGQELPNILSALGPVAIQAGQGQVAQSVRSSLGLGSEVFHTEGHVLGPTIGTLPTPLLQQIFPDLVTLEFPLLVRYPRDVRVLEFLCVELHILQVDPGDRNPPGIPPHPGEDVPHPTLHGGRQPPWRAASIVKTRRAVPQVGHPPPTAIGRPFPHAVGDQRTLVLHLSQVQDVMNLSFGSFFLPDDHYPTGLRPWVNLQHDGLEDTLLQQAVLQPNGEGA